MTRQIPANNGHVSKHIKIRARLDKIPSCFLASIRRHICKSNYCYLNVRLAIILQRHYALIFYCSALCWDLKKGFNWFKPLRSSHILSLFLLFFLIPRYLQLAEARDAAQASLERDLQGEGAQEWTDRYGDEPRKGCDILVQALEREGVQTVFAYPGGCSMEIHQALTRSPSIRNILCRHEQVSHNHPTSGPHPTRLSACLLFSSSAEVITWVICWGMSG